MWDSWAGDGFMMWKIMNIYYIWYPVLCTEVLTFLCHYITGKSSSVHFMKVSYLKCVKYQTLYIFLTVCWGWIPHQKNAAYGSHWIFCCVQIVASIHKRNKNRQKKVIIMCHMSGVTCHVSHVTCQVSHVRRQVSGVTCQVSRVRCRMSGVTCHMSIFFLLRTKWWT